MFAHTIGSKYETTKDLTRVEIAARVRSDIKDAVKKGDLPKAKYSVRCKGFSGGGSIDVRVSDVDTNKYFGFKLHNPLRLKHDHERPFETMTKEESWLHTLEARAILETLEGILDAYNYNNSDIMTDYFHVRFYGHAEWDWKYAAARKDIELKELLAEEAEFEKVLTEAEEKNEKKGYLFLGDSAVVTVGNGNGEVLPEHVSPMAKTFEVGEALGALSGIDFASEVFS